MKYSALLPELTILLLLLTGCGSVSEEVRSPEPAAAFLMETPSETEPSAVPQTEPFLTEPVDPLADKRDIFDTITREQILERLYSRGSNADYIPDYHVPGISCDALRFYVPPESGDAVQYLQGEHPNDSMECLEETDFYSIYRFPQLTEAPTMLLRQFRMAGNDYVWYDGGMDEESVLTNFDYITFNKKLLYRWYCDDPDIKCISYEFIAVQELDDGTAELGWYCYLIDREDHMASLLPEWNQKYTVPLSDDTAIKSTEESAPETTEAEGLSEQEIADMATVDLETGYLLDSDAWKQANPDTRRELAVECLKKLAVRGLIQEESIYADEDLVSYQYTCGALGGIKLTPFDPRMN